MRKAAAWSMAVIVAVLLVGAQAQALINPNFTPVLLTEQSQIIAVMKVKSVDAAGKLLLELESAVKGKPVKTLTVDLAATGQQPKTKAAVDLFKHAGDAGEPVLYFYGSYLEEGDPGPPVVGAFLSTFGKWAVLYQPEEGHLGLDDLDGKMGNSAYGMQATWAGGTDMLLRCVKYVLSDPQPEVPVGSGVTWDLRVKIGAVTGKVSHLMAVDAAGDGKPLLFAASPEGDRLLAYVKEKDPFKDVTAARGLKSRSAAAAWGDFDGDGRLDLASSDGKTVTLWLQAADGTLAPKPVDVAFKDGVIGLATLDVGARGMAGLLVSTPGAPMLLVPGEGGAMTAKALPPAPAAKEPFGKAGACVVADLDGDNLPDILQPFEKRALLYKGRGVGAFEVPTVIDVALGSPGGRAIVADFDHDGQLDVFVAAEDFCKIYQNVDGRTFHDRIDISGEIAYISKPNAIDAQVCDINNDGRQDVLIVYSNIAPQIFFNRGFRSFGHAHEIDLNDQGLLEEVREGAQAALIADFNGDGAQDLVVVDPKGGVWIFYRAIYLEAALAANAVLPLKGAYLGPLSVTGWAETRCLGTWNVVAGSAPAFFGRMDAGPLEVRWQFPGGKPQKKEIILEDKPIRLRLDPEK